jgi:hypothetical protein
MEDRTRLRLPDGDAFQLVTVGGQEDFAAMAENPERLARISTGVCPFVSRCKAGTHTITAATILRSRPTGHI